MNFYATNIIYITKTVNWICIPANINLCKRRINDIIFFLLSFCFNLLFVFAEILIIKGNRIS